MVAIDANKNHPHPSLLLIANPKAKQASSVAARLPIIKSVSFSFMVLKLLYGTLRT